MATKFGYKKDAVRVKATKIMGNCTPDTRKFSVDPQITTFDVLRNILTKAFDMKHDFTVFYRVLDDYDQETYLPLLSDWDLDAAFVSAAEPCLCLRVDMKIYEEVGEEWDSSSNSFSWITESKIPLRLPGLIMNHVEKTLNIVRGAFNFIEDIQQAQEITSQPPRPPLTDSEFRKYLDPVGQLIKPEEFRNAIYYGGVEPSLRKVVWKHLLNVYPEGLSGKQRIEYMKRKSYEYEQLKSAWKNIGNNEQMKAELSYVTGMVKKDVLRTDRHHYFYAGSDENQNIVSLFNILTTYALNHPSVSYCQGMSDLASPLLVTMDNEAHAYICFCSLMRRLSPNFLLDGVAMTQRFQHLSDGLLHYDPTFYAYLKAHQADDLLFCYRWLLLEMKREFAFEDALRMLEVMWSSLPPTVPSDDLPLYEVRFCSDSQFQPPVSPAPHETPYIKICALRRQTSCGKVLMINRSLDESVIAKRRLHPTFHNKPKKFSSLDEKTLFAERSNNVKDSSVIDLKSNTSALIVNSASSDTSSSRSFSSHEKLTPEVTEHLQFPRELRETELNQKDSLVKTSSKVIKNFNEFLTLEKKLTMKKKSRENATLHLTKTENYSESGSSCNTSPDDSSEYYPMTTSLTQQLSEDLKNLENQVFYVHLQDNEKPDEGELRNNGEDVFIWENPLQYDTQDELSENLNNINYRLDTSVNETNSSDNLECGTIRCKEKAILPGPKEFGGGNPFLMFLCIAVLCQHRDPVMRTNMDCNEIAMHFDKMVRKHNVVRVLNQARILYAAYLKQHNQNYLKV